MKAKKNGQVKLAKEETALLADLQDHPQNYQEHPDDQLEHIDASLTRNGLYKRLVVSSDNFILAGHGLRKALQRRGLKEVPIMRLPFRHDSPEALKVVAGDNEIARLAERDDRALTELLKSVSGSGLEGTGYDKRMLAALALVTRPKEEIPSIDEAAIWAGADMPEFGEKDDTIKITVNFRNKSDRDKFVEEHKLKITTYKTETAWTTWWPPKERDDLESVKFRQKKKA